nr:hypothetical protein [Tanacetum cinerariifolium]
MLEGLFNNEQALEPWISTWPTKDKLYLSSSSSTQIFDDSNILALKELKSEIRVAHQTKQIMPVYFGEPRVGTLENLLLWERNRRNDVSLVEDFKNQIHLQYLDATSALLAALANIIGTTHTLELKSHTKRERGKWKCSGKFFLIKKLWWMAWKETYFLLGVLETGRHIESIHLLIMSRKATSAKISISSDTTSLDNHIIWDVSTVTGPHLSSDMVVSDARIFDDSNIIALKELKSEIRVVHQTKQIMPVYFGEPRVGTLENLLLWERNRRNDVGLAEDFKNQIHLQYLDATSALLAALANIIGTTHTLELKSHTQELEDSDADSLPVRARGKKKQRVSESE